MRTTKVDECGFLPALFGMGLSYNVVGGASYREFLTGGVPGDIYHRLKQRTDNLAHLQGGHNKFLESIITWWEITAPRYWWSQMDTYRVATKQSESTMHTLMKKPLTQEMFEGGINLLTLDWLEYLRQQGEFDQLKAELPEAFIQKRIVCCSYKTLQNIYNQRKNHKLREWRYFCDRMLTQVNYPEFIIKKGEDLA